MLELFSSNEELFLDSIAKLKTKLESFHFQPQGICFSIIDKRESIITNSESDLKDATSSVNLY